MDGSSDVSNKVFSASKDGPNDNVKENPMEGSKLVEEDNDSSGDGFIDGNKLSWKE